MNIYNNCWEIVLTMKFLCMSTSCVRKIYKIVTLNKANKEKKTTKTKLGTAICTRM